MSEELKLCPFCGEEAKIRAVNKSYGFTIWANVNVVQEHQGIVQTQIMKLLP